MKHLWKIGTLVVALLAAPKVVSVSVPADLQPAVAGLVTVTENVVTASYTVKPVEGASTFSSAYTLPVVSVPKPPVLNEKKAVSSSKPESATERPEKRRRDGCPVDLTGVLAAEDSAYSMVLISHQGETHTYSQGDRIETRSGVFAVHAIQEERLILKRGKRTIRCHLNR